MRIALFEDRLAANFAPIALLRPVFELVCGQFPLRERLIRTLPVTGWAAFLRPELAPVYRAAHPEAAVNTLDWLRAEPTLLINGRWLPDRHALRQIIAHRPGALPDHAGMLRGCVAYLPITPADVDAFACLDFDDAVERLARNAPRTATSGTFVHWPWDLMEHNSRQLVDDFELQRGNLPPIGAQRSVIRIVGTADSHRTSVTPPADAPRPEPGAAARPPRQYVVLGSPDAVRIDPTAEIDPYVVIDARQGPVSIAAGARVQAFTRLEGPCHVGCGARLFRANVRGGTTIGPDCRVGGEVEAAILHGHVNKYHDGFLGHGYVCPWVNLGALSSNSDLKSDYSTVRVPVGSETIDTGLTKVGTFIGDHTKTGLGSLFNTGSSIGVMCLVLPAGGFVPRFMPSFTSVREGRLADGLPLERSLEAARVAMRRRDCEMGEAEAALLRWLYQQSEALRSQAISGRLRGEPRPGWPAPSRSLRAD